MTTKEKTQANAITYASPAPMTDTEVQVLTKFSTPLQTQGYAPVPAQSDRLPVYILGALVAAVVVMFGINAMDGDKRQLQVENAKLEAQQSAIAGCIQGVMK